MKILLLYQEHGAVVGTGGVGAYVMDVAPALVALGHEVHVLSCREGAQRSDTIDHGVAMHVRPLLRCRGLARIVRGQQTRLRLLLGLSNYVHARGLAAGFDVIEAPEWQAAGWAFAVVSRSRLVVHLHSPTQLLREYDADQPSRPTADDRAADWLERITTKRASLVTSPSALLIDELTARRWLRCRSSGIIRLPVDLRPWKTVPSARGSDPVVLAVGRIERRKSPELLVDAVAILRRRGFHATVTFVGRSSGERDGVPYRQWLADYAGRSKVPIEIVDECPRHQLVEVYARSRVVCVASVFESFSVAAIEAMAAGRATVVHSRVGAAEIYRGEARTQVCERSPEGIADALAPLLDDDDLAARTGENNRELVSEVCGSDIVAREREAAFSDVVACRGRGVYRFRAPSPPDRARRA